MTSVGGEWHNSSAYPGWIWKGKFVIQTLIATYQIDETLQK